MRNFDFNLQLIYIDKLILKTQKILQLWGWDM